MCVAGSKARLPRSEIWKDDGHVPLVALCSISRMLLVLEGRCRTVLSYCLWPYLLDPAPQIHSQ